MLPWVPHFKVCIVPIILSSSPSSDRKFLGSIVSHHILHRAKMGIMILYLILNPYYRFIDPIKVIWLTNAPNVYFRSEIKFKNLQAFQ